ncbi:hypothetical protein [Kitasatospora sp. NPDC056531]
MLRTSLTKATAVASLALAALVPAVAAQISTPATHAAAVSAPANTIWD